KWTAMMMPEHEEMLRQMWQEQEYKQKPILDEQKQFELNTKLQLALQNDLTVEVEYYDHNSHDSRKIKGKLLVADTLANTVRVKCLWENIYLIFGVEVVRLQCQK